MDVGTTTTSFKPTTVSAPKTNKDAAAPVSTLTAGDELLFELGLWLSGLESFLGLRNHSFVEESRAKAISRDWTKEFGLTHSALLLCSRLTYRLDKILRAQEPARLGDGELDLISGVVGSEKNVDVSADEIGRLSLVLKDAVLLNEALLRAAPLRFGEWTAWANSLSERLKSAEAVTKLILRAEKKGEEFLPEALKNLLQSKSLPFAIEADLRLILPRFAKTLKWLSVIETMLKADQPLKPALLIFSRVFEQIQETTNYINNRLLRFPNEEDALFAQLDAAAYTASIELRKVNNFELAGVAEMRSTPSIYAKIETAHALLNDSFQLTLVNFAQLIDPNIEAQRLFPKSGTKLEQSLILREHLWQVLQSVKEAEQHPDKYPMSSLHVQLANFVKTTVHFLFYKDKETVERFVEEVLVTHNKKDLVPILHRFGAYIETLFRQVNMRVVLINHPFDYEKGK